MTAARRTLSLRREALTELTAGDLTLVAGGAAGPTSPVKECAAALSVDPSCLQSCHYSCWSHYTNWC